MAAAFRFPCTTWSMVFCRCRIDCPCHCVDYRCFPGSPGCGHKSGKVSANRVMIKTDQGVISFSWSVGLTYGQTCSAAIFLHSSAQAPHSSAHSWQWSISCCSHSRAHASQMSAHAEHSNEACVPPIDINSAADLQTEAHSRSSSIHFTIIFTSSSFRHSDAQCSQANAHAMHASIQDWNLSWLILKIILV